MLWIVIVSTISLFILTLYSSVAYTLTLLIVTAYFKASRISSCTQCQKNWTWSAIHGRPRIR